MAQGKPAKPAKVPESSGMNDITFDPDHSVFAKTLLGQQEIQSRTKGLTPMVRRLLILIDGKRSGLDLQPMVAGQDLSALLQELLQKGCIEALAPAPPAPPPVATPLPTALAASARRSFDLSALPEPETRTAKDVEMARNCMTNTVNTIFQPYTRLTLLGAIAACKSAQDTRLVFVQWQQTISSSPIGARRLPEFLDKLFKVL